MAEAQFIPGAGAGNITGALDAGIGTGASLMERVQSMKIRDQQAHIAKAEEQRRASEFMMLRPAMAAKATADIAEAKAHVTGLEQTENARTAANAIIPAARADFDNLMLLADPDGREQAGLEWIGRYGHLENVADYTKEFQAKKEVVAKLHTEAAALRQLAENIKGQKEVAQIRGQTAVDTATIRADAPDKIARYQNSLNEARARNDTEAMTLYSNLLQKAQASPINTAYGSEQMQQKLEAARQAGDADEVSFWEKRIKALTERGVRKDPAALIKGIVEGLGGAKPAAGAAPAAGTPAAKPAAGTDPFSKIKL